MAPSAAVLVQNAHKSYGSKKVLDNLCMEVSRGSIYGLLGASGCGKTTLLSCIVGQRKLNSGDVWVLGGQPGTEGSGVPGPKVGFMPQDIALVGEFTVSDAIYYFGRIFDMPEREIEARFQSLSELLDLPPRERLIKNCSGGQQRRVSFAASMVQMPELLILDEPTVGVDPILRERIWDYLVEITTKHNMAVIITTHYIEETRQANTIGLMRDGKLLAEESPTYLLAKYQKEYLEDVFLLLSQKQNEGTLEDTGLDSVHNAISEISLVSTITTTQGSTNALTNNTKPKPPKRISPYSLNTKRMKALLDKNWKQLYRNVTGVIFLLLFPVVLNLSFLVAIGGDVKDIKLAIVNEESMSTLCPNFNTSDTAVPYSFTSCHFRNMSCRFLIYLEDPMIQKVQYDSLERAMEGARFGEVTGVIYMASNFSESLELRIEDGNKADEVTLDFSEIKVWLDMSNRQVGGTLKLKLFRIYTNFQKQISKECKVDPKIIEFFELHTLYGDEDSTYTDYFAPGMVLTLLFFMMTVMTSQIIVTDRSEGLWSRSTIAGVSSLEISLTHCLMQLVLVFLYTIIVFVITFWIFQMPNNGSYWTLALLTFLQGLDGLGYGFWISIISYNVTMANILVVGSFYMMILLSGVTWPIEGMPIFLQYISKSMPFTIAIESFRNVMRKGWSISSIQVWNGAGVEVIWIIIFAIINTILINAKR